MRRVPIWILRRSAELIGIWKRHPGQHKKSWDSRQSEGQRNMEMWSCSICRWPCFTKPPLNGSLALPGPVGLNMFPYSSCCYIKQIDVPCIGHLCKNCPISPCFWNADINHEEISINGILGFRFEVPFMEHPYSILLYRYTMMCCMSYL